MTVRYSATVKRSIVHNITTNQETPEQAASRLHVDLTTIYRWVRAHRIHGAHAFPGQGARRPNSPTANTSRNILPDDDVSTLVRQRDWYKNLASQLLAGPS